MTLECKNLLKRYGKKTVVDGISLRVQKGEIVGLLGPNGAGKTTTFNMISGLIEPDGGEVFKDGKKITSLPMYKRALKGVGYLTQEPSIFRNLSVEDNLKAILENVYGSKREIEEKCSRLIESLGLGKVKSQKAFLLSGGEKRRVEIARSMIRSPGIMLLDEPFVGIDPIAVYDIQEIIGGFKENGIGILVTDHNVRETLQIIDRAYIIYEGKILLSGSRRELLESPAARKVYLGNKFSM